MLASLALGANKRKFSRQCHTDYTDSFLEYRFHFFIQSLGMWMSFLRLWFNDRKACDSVAPLRLSNTGPC